MKKVVLLQACLLLFVFSINAQTIFGKWKTVDDNTGKTKSIIDIYKEDGKAYGKIKKIFPDEGDDPDPVCEECSDHRKNKKIVGMEILTDMEKDDDVWKDGKILDPENGKEYKCKIWLEDDQTLKVRGYLGFFFRTQTWHRDS